MSTDSSRVLLQSQTCGLTHQRWECSVCFFSLGLPCFTVISLWQCHLEKKEKRLSCSQGCSHFQVEQFGMRRGSQRSVAGCWSIWLLLCFQKLHVDGAKLAWKSTVHSVMLFSESISCEHREAAREDGGVSPITRVFYRLRSEGRPPVLCFL